MILKTRWVDKQLPESIKNIFLEKGEKIEFYEDEIIIDKDERVNEFYYVRKGLLAAVAYEYPKCEGAIVKFIPKSRLFGFSDFFCGKKKNLRLAAIRDSVVYKISYETMESLIREGYINKRLFRFYGRRALETKYATQAATAFVDEADIAQVIGAGLSSIKEWDEYGRYRKIVDLSGKELYGLKYICHKRKGLKRIKKQPLSNNLSVLVN